MVNVVAFCPEKPIAWVRPPGVPQCEKEPKVAEVRVAIRQNGAQGNAQVVPNCEFNRIRVHTGNACWRLKSVMELVDPLIKERKVQHAVGGVKPKVNDDQNNDQVYGGSQPVEVQRAPGNFLVVRLAVQSNPQPAARKRNTPGEHKQVQARN